MLEREARPAHWPAGRLRDEGEPKKGCQQPGCAGSIEAAALAACGVRRLVIPAAGSATRGAAAPAGGACEQKGSVEHVAPPLKGLEQRLRRIVFKDRVAARGNPMRFVTEACADYSLIARICKASSL